MSQRTARLDELLREEISGVITREVQDPRIGFVTVTGVQVAPDLRHATVWVSVIGSDEDRRQSLRVLGHSMPFIRSRLGRLRLKRIPELHVRHDDTSMRGTRVLRILDELEQGLAPDVEPIAETLPRPGPRPTPEDSPPTRVAPTASASATTDARRPDASEPPVEQRQSGGDA